jgi:sulfate permease, SulP family
MDQPANAVSSVGSWWLRHYRLSWLRPDLIAGLTTAAVVIPQAMAYAAIAGLPVEVGLYAASVPMAAYALAGTSRPLSVSVTSSIAAVTGAAIAAAPDPRQAATTLAFYCSIFLIIAWVLRLGYVADLISAPVLTGFKIGIGISIAVGQLDSLLGVSIEDDRVAQQLWSAITSVPDAKAATLIMSIACIVALLAMKRWLPRVPGPIIVVALTILATWLWDLQDHGIALIDPVPSGLPLPSLPHFAGSLHFVVPALGVALVAFVESISAARAFQRPDDRPVSADRELGALGLANVISSLFRGMPAGGGMSQTAVNDGAGARSPMAAISTAATVILTLLFLAPLFSYLPQVALGALVFVAAVGLVDINTLRRIFTVERRDGVLAIIAALAVIAAGALYGILAAVLISVLTLLFQLSRRPLEIVQTVPAPDAEQISIPAGMLLVRPRSDIFFANVQHFRRDLYAALAARDPKPTILLVDGSRRYLFEFTANQTLREIIADLRKQGLEIWIVLPPGDPGDAVRRFRQVFGPGDAEFFPRVSDAVAAHLDELEGRD